jgi:putative methionine-R-sulfoxide reductase with GAF domain
VPARARDYASIVARARVVADRQSAMEDAVRSLWDLLRPCGVSWLGIYIKAAGSEQLVLGPCRDRPACSPIGLHGVCGRALRERRTIVVRDARVLGEAYIACDPRDLSEVAVPLFNPGGTCWGVMDADSEEVGAFGEADAAGLAAVAERLGLSERPATGRPALMI